jgi:hypothetical protein
MSVHLNGVVNGVVACSYGFSVPCFDSVHSVTAITAANLSDSGASNLKGGTWKSKAR